MQNPSMLSNRSQKTDDSNQDDYEPGNYELAKMHKQNLMVRYRDKNGHLQQYDFMTSLDKLGKLGIGVELYFKFLRFFTVVFLLMGLATIPALYSNYNGNGLADLTSSSYLMKFTLANQPLLVVSYPSNTSLNWWNDSANAASVQAVIDNNNKIMNQYVEDQKINFYYTCGSDLVAILIFLIGVQIFRLIETNAIEQNKKKIISLVDYSIKVSNFPSDIINEQIIHDHFSQFGEVIEAGLARNYSGTLNNFKQESILNKKIIVENKRLELNPKRKGYRLKALEKEKKRLHEKTLKKMGNELKGLTHDEFPSLWAYVVFNRIQDKNNVMQAYHHFNRWSFKRIFCNCCWSLKKATRPNFLLQGEYPLILEEPDVPSNILWDNQEVTWCQRFKKKMLSFFLTIIVFAITLSIVLLASVVTKAKKDCLIQYDQLASSGSFDPNTGTTDQMMCYCTQIGKNYYNTNQGDVCYQSAKDAFYTQILSIVSSIIIIVTNSALQFLILYLSQFERYKTVTLQTYTSISRLTLVLFINTGILTLLLNSEINSFNFSHYFIQLYPSMKKYFHDNSSSARADFDRLWYPQIGSKVQFTLLIMIVSPHAIQSLLGPCINAFKGCVARCKFLQVDMNNAILPPSFDLTKKYSHILNMLFVTMLYSSGMPVLYFVAFLVFFSSYLFQKYILLRVSSRPVKYSETISQNVTNLLSYAVVLKIFMCLWVYTTPDIYPEASELYLEINKNQALTNNGSISLEWKFSLNPSTYYDRVIKQFYFTCVVFIVAAYVLSEQYIRGFLRIVKKFFFYLCCCCCCIKNNKVSADLEKKAARYGDYEQEYDNLKTAGTTTYKIRENPKYRDLVYALDFQDMDVAEMSVKKSTKQSRAISQVSQNNSQEDSRQDLEDEEAQLKYQEADNQQKQKEEQGIEEQNI